MNVVEAGLLFRSAVTCSTARKCPKLKADLQKKRSCETNQRKWKNRKNNERRLAGMHILCITTGVRLLLNAVTLTYRRDYTFLRTKHVNRTVSAVMVRKFLIAYVHGYRQNIHYWSNDWFYWNFSPFYCPVTTIECSVLLFWFLEYV